MNDETNSVKLMYDTFCKHYRNEYAYESDDDAIQTAFCHGILAAFSMTGLHPDNLLNNVTHRSVKQELEDLLNHRVLQS